MRIKFKIDKLHRDKTADILRAKGEAIKEYALTDDADYIKALNNKLIEETHEVIEATNKAEIAEELADVLEVMHALAKVHGITMDVVEVERVKKYEAKGGFYNRLFAVWMEVEEGSDSYKKLKSAPDRYPEIKE